MRKEIANRQMEAKNLREDLETTQRQIAMDSKDHEKLLEELEDIKVCRR